MAMAQNKQSKNKSRRSHWFRVAVMIMSAGFIFPNELSEDLDTPSADHGADKDAKVKKQ